MEIERKVETLYYIIYKKEFTNDKQNKQINRMYPMLRLKRS